MKKYFKIMGILELASWFAGMITLIIYMGPIISAAKPEYKGGVIFGLIISLISLAITGPALGFLFIHYSNNIKEKSNLDNNN